MSTKQRAWVRENHRSKAENRHPSKRRWEVVYTDPDTHKRRTKGGFATKQAAQDWAEEFTSSARRGSWIDPERARVTFGALALRWWGEQHFDRERTRDDYRKMFSGNNPLMERFGATPIGEVTPSAVSVFIRDAAQIRAPQTVRHYFYALRVVLDYAVDNGLLLVNPARRVNLRRLPTPASMREHERKRDRLTTEQVDRLVGALPEPYDMYVLLLAGTGMRPEEACGLTLGDVDLTDQSVYVHEVVVDVSGRLVREEAVKTQTSRRTIDLDPYVGAALNRYTNEHRKRAAAWFADHPDHDHPGEALPLLVGAMTGRANGSAPLDRLDYSKPLRHGAFYKRYWRKATRAAGLPDSVRVYDLRHFHASTLLDAGMTIKDVQERLGHATPTMTLDRYWHSRTDDDARRQRRAALTSALGRTPENVTPIKAKRRTGSA